MDFATMAVMAMRAGLNGDRMPNFGDRLTREQLGVLNAVYEQGRNWNAGQRVRAS